MGFQSFLSMSLSHLQPKSLAICVARRLCCTNVAGDFCHVAPRGITLCLPLPLCGAWRAARGSAASDAYSHTNKPPQHNCTRLAPRTEMRALVDIRVQLFSQKSRTPTVAKEFQIGLCGVVEADLELFCNCWSAGFLGERL